MSNLVIERPQPTLVPVRGGGAFPIRRVFCVGRNYAAHAREMGADPTREPPFFFTKPSDAVLASSRISFPMATQSLHFEMELVVALKSGGSEISAAEALDHVYGYAPGVDLTRRDLQDEAKALRRPWDMSKGFDESGPIGEIVPVPHSGHPASGRISLSVNGTLRQNGDLSDIIWPVPDIIAYLSTLVALKAGDLIFTGTPEGVGAIQRGDTVSGSIEGIGSLTFDLV